VFQEPLKKIVQEVEGGIGGVIMGLDGIAVETFMNDQDGFDVNIIGMEFSFIMTQVKRAAEALKVGGVQEFSVKAERLLLVIRMLTDEYFVAVVLHPQGNFGKCRFLLRMLAPKLVIDLT
jgi:predicted regulator of Ras-like GTPase activity (Roadblock/LC7/MglB family)